MKQLLFFTVILILNFAQPGYACQNLSRAFFEHNKDSKAVGVYQQSGF
jgi:hypothetical protein